MHVAIRPAKVKGSCPACCVVSSKSSSLFPGPSSRKRQPSPTQAGGSLGSVPSGAQLGASSSLNRLLCGLHLEL